MLELNVAYPTNLGNQVKRVRLSLRETSHRQALIILESSILRRHGVQRHLGDFRLSPIVSQFGTLSNHKAIPF